MTSNNIQTSGGIFTHHFVESLQQENLNHPAVRAETFTLPNQSRLSERELEAQIASAWAILVERWDTIEREFNSLDISALRQRWFKPLFQQLGFSLDFLKADLVLEEELRFPISHLGSIEGVHTSVPIHTVLYKGEDTLETRAVSGRGVKAHAPHDMMQRYLNLNKRHRWGIVGDGVYLRLLRDFFHSYTRGYTEFDLQGIFSSRDYAGFRAMYRLLHASRFITPEGKDAAPIDDLYDDALAMGVKVGEDLRTNVQAAIESLGNGFLSSTPGFMEKVNSQPDGAGQLYRDILMTIYRMLFLLFAEQRGMLPGRGSLYTEEFSLTAFRTLAEEPRKEDRNFDLWEKLRTTFAMVEHGVPELKIFAYNGALFSLHRTQLLTPDDTKQAPRCRNDHLLQTIRHLTTVEKEHVLQRISYSDLSVEEIGSIYESLLEITPRITESAIEVDGRSIPANTFYLDPRGKGRKTTGSYYTPPSLVNELIKSALVPVMLERIQAVVPGYDPELVEALTEEEKVAAETALLAIKVVDPAAGSGAFLIAANNKLGLELARIRTGSVFPPEDTIRHARRDVLAHCIHGVDLNPMAVELCKVSLWINAAVEDAPLNFLDHHIQCGNSLVGATPALVKGGIPNEAYNAVTGDDAAIANSLKRQNRAELAGQGSLALRLTEIKTKEDVTHFSEVRELAERDPGQAEKAYYAYWGSGDYWTQRLPFDLWTAAFFAPLVAGQPVPTTHDVRQALIDPKLITLEKCVLARLLAEKHRFFHWHLAFPEVFDPEGNGGFDVVLGNPPWERIKLEEKEYFEFIDHAVATARTAAIRKKLIEDLRESEFEVFSNYIESLVFSEKLSIFLRESNRFPLTAIGDINTYQVFAGLARQTINPMGRIGIILPSGIATSFYTQDFFSAIIENKELVSLYDFENTKKLFPDVAPIVKFCLLTLAGSQVNSDCFEFAYFLQSIDELFEINRTFVLTSEEIHLINPNTNNSPVFRSKFDANVIKKIYRNSNILVNELSRDNHWDIEFSSMFHMTNDSHLFSTKEDLEAEGYTLAGNIFIKGQEKYLPLYEAKLIKQYDHRHGTFSGLPTERMFVAKAATRLPTLEEKLDPKFIVIPRFWVKERDAIKSLGDRGYQPYFFAFRNTIQPMTNARCSMFTPIPFVAVGNNSPLLIFNKLPVEYRLFLLSNLNCYVFDFVTGQKMGGASLNFYIIKQLPVIDRQRVSRQIVEYITPRVFELTYNAWDLSAYAYDVYSKLDHSLKLKIEQQWKDNHTDLQYDSVHVELPDWIIYYSNNKEFPISPFVWNSERRFDLQCDLDALFGHLYNLTRDEIVFVLESFQMVKRKDEQEFGEYRTKRVILEKFDAMGNDPILEGACIPLAERVSVLQNPGKAQPHMQQTEQPVVVRPSTPAPAPAPPAHESGKQLREKKGAQPVLFEDKAELNAAPEPKVIEYHVYRCKECGASVFCYAKDDTSPLEEHTRSVHQGVDPGYRKLI